MAGKRKGVRDQSNLLGKTGWWRARGIGNVQERTGGRGGGENKAERSSSRGRKMAILRNMEKREGIF